MDSKERARRFHQARIFLNQHGEETKLKVYETTGIPASVIVAYENPESTRSLNIENVQKLANHYGVNAAWLLGLSESWTLETDIRQISEVTGLSPEAIQALQKLTKDENQRFFVNAFLASEEFSQLIRILPSPNHPAHAESDPVVDYSSAINQLKEESTISFGESEARDLRLWKASRNLEKILDKLL